MSDPGTTCMHCGMRLWHTDAETWVDSMGSTVCSVGGTHARSWMLPRKSDPSTTSGGLQSTCGFCERPIVRTVDRPWTDDLGSVRCTSDSYGHSPMPVAGSVSRSEPLPPRGGPLGRLVSHDRRTGLTAERREAIRRGYANNLDVLELLDALEETEAKISTAHREASQIGAAWALERAAKEWRQYFGTDLRWSPEGIHDWLMANAAKFKQPTTKENDHE